MQAQEPRTPPADLILHGGKVVTVDEPFSIHQAVAVREGRILATGSDAELMPLRGPSTQMVNLGGKLVLPGLIDSHTHPTGAALTEFDHRIPAMESIGDVLAHVRERASALKPGEWIQISQVFITRLREQRYPTRAELDAAAPKNPVIFSTGPDASVNSQALEISGMTREFKVDDDGTGFAEKDPVTGELTGILRNCSRYVKAKSPDKRATPEQQEARLRELFTDYNSVGITSVADRNTSADGLERYRALRSRDALTVRVTCSQGVPGSGPWEKAEAQIRAAGRSEIHTTRDPWLRVVGVKTFLDGGMLTGSAYMSQPWGVSTIYGISDPAYRGVLFIQRERLRMMVRTALEAGLQFTAHAQGDGAIEELLSVYEELAAEGMPVRENRCCLTHASFLRPDLITRAARIGVVLDLQPAWLYLDARTLLAQFGMERMRWLIPLRTLFESGAVVGGGSDHMQKIDALAGINPYSPFLGIATAVTRRARWCDAPVHPEEALTREQAVRFYTIQNARVLFREEEVGSIERGKFADLIVLDTDLLTCPEQRIADARVLRTYVGGKVVWERP